MTDTLFAERLPDELPSDPMHLAYAWIQEAHTAKLRRNSNSMTLVTIKSDGNPAARIVLCKDFVPDPGFLVFYTNFNSSKALDIETNPDVAAVFHWDGPGRQIRIWANAIELWKDGADRIHDRALWKRTLMRTSEHEFATTPWAGTRLQP